MGLSRVPYYTWGPFRGTLAAVPVAHLGGRAVVHLPRSTPKSGMIAKLTLTAILMGAPADAAPAAADVAPAAADLAPAAADAALAASTPLVVALDPQSDRRRHRRRHEHPYHGRHHPGHGPTPGPAAWLLFALGATGIGIAAGAAGRRRRVECVQRLES